MSLESWKKEFITDTGDLVQDGINKWTGVIKENLEKHDCSQNYRDIIGPRFGVFDLFNCGLCEKYRFDGDCGTCPLYRSREGISCDNLVEDEDLSPWSEGIHGNPKPMVKWLEKAKNYQESNTDK